MQYIWNEIVWFFNHTGYFTVYNILETPIQHLVVKALFILSIVFGALSDAYKDDNNGKRQHTYEVINIGSLFIGILITNFWFITITCWLTYILFRIGLFNMVYNRKRRLPRYYVGTTDKWFDKYILWLSRIEETKMPILTAIYGLCIFIALFI